MSSSVSGTARCSVSTTTIGWCRTFVQCSWLWISRCRNGERRLNGRRERRFHGATIVAKDAANPAGGSGDRSRSRVAAAERLPYMKGIISAAVLIAQVVASTQIAKYDPGRASSAHVVMRLRSGHCTASTNAPGRNAYRCVTTGYVFDPCFGLPNGSVACPTDVADNKAVVIGLPKISVSADKRGATRHPWAMLLASGAYCQAATAVRVEAFPFHCDGAESLCTSPDLSKNAPAYFVRCGRPIPDDVVDVSPSLVKVAYW